jgi:hypothetical protein
MDMKKIIMSTLIMSSQTAFSWGGVYYPGWWPGYPPGMGYVMPYAGTNTMSVIQTPSFTYNTTIIQSPPIIVNQSGDVVTIPSSSSQGSTIQPLLNRR